jgi:mRNA-degrading endonuclease YafQ of YafQ-DinJ toxin-antitoxin module
MDFDVSSELDKKLKKVKSTDKQLFQKVGKQLSLFHANHLHPSLRLHKLSGNFKNIWSISIDKNTRMLLVLDEEGAYFFDIGTHDQIYRK